MQEDIIRSMRQNFSVRYTYPVIFTSGAFKVSNPVLENVIAQSGIKHPKMVVIADSGLVKAWPDLPGDIETYVNKNEALPQLAAPVCILTGGEACKNDGTAVSIVHELIRQSKLCRHSVVLAVGGGAVLDAAGYAVATAHGGIRLIRMPTTTLAQNDAGIGVKNAVNAFGRKNFIGVFAPPLAVINDFDFLRTLPEKEMRAGIAEAVKISLTRDRSFFYFLYDARYRLRLLDPDTTRQMILKCAELNFRHITEGREPYGSGISDPLDFGHWSAHKLEMLSNGEIGHGEAVAIGIALDSVYSWRRGLISLEELARILSVLADSGFDLYHPVLEDVDVGMAMSDFQEHVGGEFSLPLIRGIGNAIQVCQVDIPVYEECIADLAASQIDQDEQASMPDDRRKNTRYVPSGEPRDKA